MPARNEWFVDSKMSHRGAPTREATRSESEFVAHVTRTVAVVPTGRCIFVVDDLNTHCSRCLVDGMAAQCSPTDPFEWTDNGEPLKQQQAAEDGPPSALRPSPSPRRILRTTQSAISLADG